MSAADVDAYLAQVPQPQRNTLETVRTRLKEVLPEAQEVIQYGVPGFKLDGVGVAGYSASKNHCSYLPMSGTVLAGMAAQLEGFQWSKGALRFGVDEPLSAELIEALVTARVEEIRAKNV